MNNNTAVLELKVCSCCNEEKPATKEYFHVNKKNGRLFLYSVCKVCKRNKYTKKERQYKKCLYCKEPFEAKRADKRYCSSKCAYDHKNSPTSKSKREEVKCAICGERSERNRNKYCTKCKNIKVKRNCVSCNTEFDAEIYRQTKFCSDKCRNKDSIRKKKIFDEANGKFLSRKEIFSLEKYKCKNCDCTTDKTFGYIKGTLIPKPTSPTIDHIIPLNHGGTHTLRNVQLLCYKCNHKKQDGYLDLGEQLKMF